MQKTLVNWMGNLATTFHSWVAKFADLIWKSVPAQIEDKERPRELERKNGLKNKMKERIVKCFLAPQVPWKTVFKRCLFFVGSLLLWFELYDKWFWPPGEFSMISLKLPILDQLDSRPFEQWQTPGQFALVAQFGDTVHWAPEWCVLYPMLCALSINIKCAYGEGAWSQVPLVQYCLMS